MSRLCPFCGANARHELCPGCGRNVGLPRLICTSCQKQTPKAEKVCCHCGQSQKSDLRWKLPLIIAMFVAAAILTVLLEVYG